MELRLFSPRKALRHGKAGKVLLFLLGLWGVKTLLTKLRTRLIKRVYDRKRKEYQKTCREMLLDLEQHVRQSKLTTSEVESITSLNFVTLLGKLQRGDLQPSTVLIAYQVKALEVHKQTNCLIHPLPEAVAIARDLDSATDRNKPLFGIPISIKDDQALKGYSCSLGSVALMFDEFEDDCHLIKFLKKQGAVPFVKTNVAQLCFSNQTSNPIFGETSNPLDSTRTPGGSSGGESALVAGGGSILGVGTDIGGSLRAPAHFTGMCTLKTTSERLCTKGQAHTHEQSGQNRLLVSVGPMARDVETVVAFMRVLYHEDIYREDMLAAPVAFREQVYNEKRKLRIGMFYNDDIFPVTPACKRAVLVAKSVFEKMGHQVVNWIPPNPMRGKQIFMNDVMADNLEICSDLLRGDIEDGCMVGLFEFAQGEDSLWRKLLTKFIGLWDKERSENMAITESATGVAHYWETGAMANIWRREVEQSFRDAELDIFVCPGFPTVAPVKGPQTEWQLKCGGPHTFIWNALGNPVGSVPVSKVIQEDITELKDYTGNLPQKMLANVKKEMETGLGLPVGVQVGAMKFEDELVLRAMMELQEGLKEVVAEQ